MKKFIALIFIFFVSMGLSLAEDLKILPSQVGVVQNVRYVDIDNSITDVKQTADIRITNGEHKGNSILVDNMLTGNPYYDIKLKKGVKVILHVEEDESGELIYSIEDIQRSPILLCLSFLFCLLLVYVGRKKGLYSLVSIVMTCLLIINLLVPVILQGINPVLATILICLFATALTMFLVGGINKKSLSATIGCTLSLIIAGVFSILTVKFANLTGFSNEDSNFLFMVRPELNFLAITVSMMILATLGAVMDVAMSIASTINEIYDLNNNITTRELFVSGMNVGKDIIGTMANTLILVYLGSSLPLLLLASNIDMQKFVNLNQVVTEISSALIGSITLVICVPITAFIASHLVKRSVVLHIDTTFKD